IAQKVANYPGVTTEVRSGHAGSLVIHDYPGIYSLEPLTLDERVAIERLEKALADERTKAIVCVLDATRLERTLYLLLQLPPRPPLPPPGPPRVHPPRRGRRPARPPRPPRPERRPGLPRHRHLGQDRPGPRRAPVDASSAGPRATLG